ncbi:endonuclease [Bacillus phage Riley]|uniref:HNH nuclease domain-containing protein n=1 Tax=Bacillus phage Riley TaxID=1486662 RepID=A0A075M0I4_9CAUD|nr:endonuclease [Bacillus phage Riley]AIF72134.1 hypothetical protein [Bacillus phage Riley]ULF48883.1 HNH endonuclease [Bacillus phage BillyBob]
MPYINENIELHGNAKRIEYEIDNNSCWNCTSHSKDSFGYCFITRTGMQGATYIHRYVYTIHNGDIPQDRVIRHKCDNPSCINPSHLEVGTQQENLKDAESRGRAAIKSGSGNIKAKLSEEQVKEIKELLKKGVVQKEIASTYGVGNSTISRIKHNVSWSATK